MFEQPKTDEVVTSARKGTCAVCGAKDVLVTHPPLPRHVDMKACDRQRAWNAATRSAFTVKHRIELASIEKIDAIETRMIALLERVAKRPA